MGRRVQICCQCHVIEVGFCKNLRYYIKIIVCLALREKRTTVVAQLKQLQAETEPIVKMFEDPETTRQMQSTR